MLEYMYMVATCSSGAALLRLYPASASKTGHAPVCTKLLLLLTVSTDLSTVSFTYNTQTGHYSV